MFASKASRCRGTRGAALCWPPSAAVRRRASVVAARLVASIRRARFDGRASSATGASSSIAASAGVGAGLTWSSAASAGAGAPTVTPSPSTFVSGRAMDPRAATTSSAARPAACGFKTQRTQ